MSSTPDAVNTRRFLWFCVLSCVSGFIALSEEIIWMRAVSYVTGGRPVVFSNVLGSYLLGLALGALAGNRLSRHSGRILGFSGVFLFASSALFGLALPLVGWAYSLSATAGTISLYAGITGVALLSGITFPLICQASASEADTTGKSSGFGVAWIYFANIIGATLGPLFTGFVLLDHLGIGEAAKLMASLGMLLGAVVTGVSYRAFIASKTIIKGAALVVATISVIVIASGVGHDRLLEKLHFKNSVNQVEPYKYVRQNRSGVIAIHPDSTRLKGYVTDVIYGGAIYDGTFNTDPLHDTNHIFRAYMSLFLHRNPGDVLMIGLASGSWARVIANHTAVKKMEIVEINPAYVDLMSLYPDQKTLLNDPKVLIHTDDGRRWLARNPDKKFDLIVMNTTFHWRDGATGLLSGEFLQLVRRALRPGGVVFYNTTYSDEVTYTAAQHFKHVTLIMNFVAASDSQFDMTAEEKRETLKGFVEDGQPLFNRSPEHASVAEKYVNLPIEELRPQLLRRTDLLAITDDNLATEFKLGRRSWKDDRLSWTNVFNRLRF